MAVSPLLPPGGVARAKVLVGRGLGSVARLHDAGAVEPGRSAGHVEPFAAVDLLPGTLISRQPGS